MYSTTLLLMNFLCRKCISLFNALCGAKPLRPFISLFGGSTIVAVILTLLNVSTFHMGNPHMLLTNCFNVGVYKVAIIQNADASINLCIMTQGII